MQDKPQINQRSDKMMQKVNHKPIFSDERMRTERLKKESLEMMVKLKKAQQEEAEISELKLKDTQDEKKKINPEKFIQNLQQREAKFKTKWDKSKQAYLQNKEAEE